MTGWNTQLAVALLAATLNSAASAADRAGNYAIWGAGGRSCNQFENARSDAPALSPFRDYLMGYLTAVNSLSQDTYDAIGGAPLETALEWLGEYCAQHRMESFERAISQVLTERHDARLHAPPGSLRGWGAGSDSAASGTQDAPSTP